MENQIFIIEHEKANVCKTFDTDDYRYQGLQFTHEHYYYHKPHGVEHSSLSDEWRLFTCMFGVCVVNVNDLRDKDEVLTKEYELSRENKKQLLVGPEIEVSWTNISGKAVMTQKTCS
jgi:dTDP-4-dehydrorhamnose 3,5-epimerase-like enzyme